jgi:hypothetical protein
VKANLWKVLIKALQEEFFGGYAPPERVKEVAREALRDLVQGNLDNTIEKLLAEAKRQSKKVLYSFLKDLGLPPLPAVEEALQKGEEVGIWPWWEMEEVVVTLGLPSSGFHRESVPLPRKWTKKEWPDISVDTHFGGIEPRLKVEKVEKIWVDSEPKERLVFRLDASRGRAFFYGVDPEATAEALEVFRAFRRLFYALGLEDLRKALEELELADDGEARQLGEYILVRRDGIRAVLRGSIFGDLALDEAFLLDHEVNFLSPSGDLAISLRCHFHGYGVTGGEIEIAEGTVRWKDAEINFSSSNRVDVLTEDLGDALLKEALRTVLAWYAPPPVLEALIEALLDEERPSQALKDELFLQTLPIIVFGKLSS